jgi:hypothetical protein
VFSTIATRRCAQPASRARGGQPTVTLPRVIGSGLELVRPGGGRNYELRRNGEVVATFHRRGLFRPRYTAVIGDANWRIEKPRSQRVAVVDESSGEEVGRLDVVDDEYRLFAGDEGAGPAMRYEAGERSFYDDDGNRLMTLRHLGGWKEKIATVAPGERPWPSVDPDAGTALALAVLVARLIAERDVKSAEDFSAT